MDCDLVSNGQVMSFLRLLILWEQLLQHRILIFFKEYCRQKTLESFGYKNSRSTIEGTRCTLFSIKTSKKLVQGQLIMSFKYQKKMDRDLDFKRTSYELFTFVDILLICDFRSIERNQTEIKRTRLQLTFFILNLSFLSWT